jgi:cell division initiation protein
MNISPKDIKKNDFRKTFRGIDPHEVEAFLETVSSHYEKILIENSQLHEKIRTLTSDLEIYKENEATLQKAIVKSQELTDEILENAKKKAENIVKESELNAQKIMQEMDKEILTKKHELEDIKLRNEKLMDDIRSFLSDKLSDLEEFMKGRNVIKMQLAKEEDTEEEPQNIRRISSLTNLDPSVYEENADVK